MIDKLAALQHDIWSHWMMYLFEVSISNEDGSVTIPPEKAVRWKRQMETSYENLPIEEQKSDIEQAAKIVRLIDEWQKQ